MTEIVLVTGAGGALGAEVARALAKRGDRVALMDMPRGEERMRALATELGGDAKTCVLTGDGATDAGWSLAMGKIREKWGAAPSLAALVAGGWKGGANLYEEKGDDAWRAMMSSNADTVYLGLRALLPGMVAASHGSIVIVGSRAAVRPWTSAGASAYAASKAAAVALVETTAEEVRPSGVRVNAILPSTMDTPANRAAMPDVDPKTWVSLSSAAGVIAFLLSDAARDVTGAALPVYGRA